MNFSSTLAKVVFTSTVLAAALAGCNKKADAPASTASPATQATAETNPDLNKPSNGAGPADSNTNPGNTSAAPSTPSAPEPASTTQTPSSTTSTNQ